MDASSQRVLEQAPRRKLFLGLQDFFLGHEAIGSAPRLRVEDDVLRCRLSRDRGGGGGGRRGSGSNSTGPRRRQRLQSRATIENLSPTIFYTIRYDTIHDILRV